jgi:hypothetical protein
MIFFPIVTQDGQVLFSCNISGKTHPSVVIEVAQSARAKDILTEMQASAILNQTTNSFGALFSCGGRLYKSLHISLECGAHQYE